MMYVFHIVKSYTKAEGEVRLVYIYRLGSGNVM